MGLGVAFQSPAAALHSSSHLPTCHKQRTISTFVDTDYKAQQHCCTAALLYSTYHGRVGLTQVFGHVLLDAQHSMAECMLPKSAQIMPQVQLARRGDMRRQTQVAGVWTNGDSIHSLRKSGTFMTVHSTPTGPDLFALHGSLQMQDTALCSKVGMLVLLHHLQVNLTRLSVLKQAWWEGASGGHYVDCSRSCWPNWREEVPAAAAEGAAGPCQKSRETRLHLSAVLPAGEGSMMDLLSQLVSQWTLP